MALNIGFVGAGRVGRTLGRQLRGLGWPIGVVVTRRNATARRAVRAIGSGEPHAGLTRRLMMADVVLITTPDHAIRDVAARLARIGGDEWRGKTVLHTSGAFDRRVLAPLARCGAATGSLHPLQTFSGRATPRLEGVVFAIEGDATSRRVARQIARALGGLPVAIKGRNKPAYHAAGAFVSGHVLAVMEGASRILMDLGFTRREATRALLPLVRQTLDNFVRLGPRSAWTGPLSRSDYETVARHAAALERKPGEFRAAYAALTRLAARILSPHPGATLRQVSRVLARKQPHSPGPGRRSSEGETP